MDNKDREMLEEVLKAIKERPEELDIGVAKIRETIEDCDIDCIMQDIEFPKILNTVGLMIMHTMTLSATNETLKYTDLQTRKFGELQAEISKLLIKHTLNYAEVLCFIADFFDKTLRNNPKTNPEIYRRKEE